jgi:hypothetical protein
VTDALEALLAANAAPRAEFAYIDDTGDPGMKGGSRTFGLGCVLVPMDHWTDRLDLLIEMRRNLRGAYGLRMRDEVKGEWLAGVKKHFRSLGLGDGQLRYIYQQHLRMLPTVASGAFAVVFDKDAITKRNLDVEEMAWTYLLQRLRMRAKQTGAPIVVVHDGTSKAASIVKTVRKARRHLWVAGAWESAPMVIEDPTPRRSDESYFIQLADLVAYAAGRKVVPARGRGYLICSDRMWDEIGSARMTEVHSARGDGIVSWP